MKFKKFEDIGVSTMTFTATSNSIFNISRLFNELPITKYTPVKKNEEEKRKTSNRSTQVKNLVLDRL